MDAQIDDVQRQAYQVKINTCDVPNDSFVFASKAWQMYRAGEADPARFGIFAGGPAGVAFIRSGLVRDLAALNKQELLCQDVWGLAEVQDEKTLSRDDQELLDRVAALTLSGNAFAEMQMLYQRESRLRVPSTIKCFAQNEVKMIDIATGVEEDI